MRLNGQEELPLWPLPRWPSPAYISDAFALYLSASLLVGFLFLVAVTAIARPLWVGIFVAGVVAGVFGFRWFRVVLRRRLVSRIMDMFPHHA
jgi:Flp pilus assembly protein TadB